MSKFEWRDGQIWDIERGCWVTWQTITGKMFISPHMRVQIIDLLNDGPGLYVVQAAAQKFIATRKVGRGYHADVQSFEGLKNAVAAVEAEQLRRSAK